MREASACRHLGRRASAHAPTYTHARTQEREGHTAGTPLFVGRFYFVRLFVCEPRYDTMKVDLHRPQKRHSGKQSTHTHAQHTRSHQNIETRRRDLPEVLHDCVLRSEVCRARRNVLHHHACDPLRPRTIASAERPSRPRTVAMAARPLFIASHTSSTFNGFLWETTKMRYDYRNATFHVIGAGMRTVKAHNHEVVRLLEELAEHDFFAYFPVNLITPCMYFPSGDSGSRHEYL